jgi:hypothetical protein
MEEQWNMVEELLKSNKQTKHLNNKIFQKQDEKE